MNDELLVMLLRKTVCHDTCMDTCKATLCLMHTRCDFIPSTSIPPCLPQPIHTCVPSVTLVHGRPKSGFVIP
jgi:hypothetical protein